MSVASQDVPTTFDKLQGYFKEKGDSYGIDATWFIVHPSRDQLIRIGDSDRFWTGKTYRGYNTSFRAGIETNVFIPPDWKLNNDSIKVLEKLGFKLAEDLLPE